VKIIGQIETLEALAGLDVELGSIDEQLTEQREAFTKKKELLDQLGTRLAVSRESLAEMERTRNDLMAELRSMGGQVEKSREKLARCRTEREANAAQREVEEIRKLLRDREVEIEKIGQLIEQARGDVQATESEQAQLSTELGSSEGEISEQLKQLESEATRRREERKQIVAKIQPVIYRRYELVRKRRGSAIAAVEDGTCTACHVRLPPMLHHQLMRGEDFGQCPMCNRIIYAKPPSLDAAEPEAADGHSSA